MFEKEEQKLLKLNEKIQTAAKPVDMEQYIKNGIRLGIRRKQRIRIKYIVNAAAILIIAVFLTSIRIFPVFAAYVESIPGLEYIVKLVNYDKGIKDIVNNNFVRHVNASDEKEGIKVTIKDMIIDNSRAIIFYQIENKSTYKNIDIDDLKIKNEKGEEVKEISFSWGSVPEDMHVNKEPENSIELNFTDKTILPEKFILDFKLRADGPTADKNIILSPSWSFEIPTDKGKFKDMEKTYVLNQTAQIQGQKILFKTAKVTPTRIAVDIEYDRNNTKKILRFDDICIVNEKGEKWATIMNGFSGTRLDDDHEVLYFQSNYFSASKQLYITGTRIRAVDKTKSVVEVDIKNNNLINAPDDKLKLESITEGSSETSIKFSLAADKKLDKNYSYDLFYSIYKDSDGKSINSKSSSCSAGGNGPQIIGYIVPNNAKFPIYLTLDDYPARIKGSFKIKIK